jgi:hypothetical protein
MFEICKGQEVSEGNCGVFNSPKRETIRKIPLKSG